MGEAARAQSDRHAGRASPERLDAGPGPQAPSHRGLQGLESGRSVRALLDHRRAIASLGSSGAPVFAAFHMLTGPCAKRGRCTKAKACTNKSVMARIAAFSVVIGATLAAGPVAAQFGGTFGDSPPRPPADVPSPFPAQPPPGPYPGQYPAQQQPPAQQYPRHQQNSPQQSATRAPGGIQSQPLPPPGGASLAPAPQNRAVPAPAVPASPQPADAPPRPEDTVVTETPTQKIENARAVFAGLDKITGRTISFDAAIGETVQFGALQVTARACYTRPPT